MTPGAANGADWLCAALVEQGIEVLFGNPGSTELPLTDALGRAGRGPRYVLGLHEAAVMGMADGHAQASGRLAAVNVHVQPGLANAMSGILNASRARVPLLVTVGQQVQSLLPGDPFLGGDVVGMARTVAKGAWEVTDAKALPATLALAARTAMRPPRGPVVVSLPLDVQVAPAPAPYSRPVDGPAPPDPDPAAAAAAGALIGSAASPVVIAGDEVARAGASGPIARLAERIGAPLYGEPVAATVPVPTDHPHWRGMLPPFAADIRRALDGHDVVVAIGMPVFRLFGDSPGPALPAGARLVHIDVDPRELGRSHPPAVGIAAAPGPAVEAVLGRLGPLPGAPGRARSVVADAAGARRRARRAVALGAARADGGIGPEALCLAVAGAVGPRDLVVDEALTAGRPLRAVISRRTSSTWLAHRGSALGWGLPAAVGAALAAPSRRVLAIQGDGSLLFGIHALWTAAREGVGVALVVADNGGYEILRAGMEGLTGRSHGPWPGLAIAGPPVDAVSLCRGFGASAERVSHRADLPDALGDLWLRARGAPAALVVDVTGDTAPVGYPLPAR